MPTGATLSMAPNRPNATTGAPVFNSIGPTELIIVLVIVLLIFGPKRLPGLGRQLGGGLREFKDSIARRDSEDDDDDEDEPQPIRTRADSGQRDAAAALGRPEGEPTVTDGRVTRDRTAG
jgi:sec-independent protein translocase protein TatA